MKKRSIIVIVILILVLTINLILFNNKNNSLKNINKINEYSNILVNTKDKTIIVDKEKLKLSDFLNIREEELNKLIKEKNLHSYLEKYAIGDITESTKEIKINNPYKTKSLIVETLNKEAILADPDVSNIEEIADNIYRVDYNSIDKTKEGYNELKEESKIENVTPDVELEMFEKNITNSFSVSSSNYAWGLNSTGLDNYKELLNSIDTDSSVKVAVLDTGVRKTHEVFKNTTTSDRLDFTKSYDFINNDSDATDDNGHGTEVAGVVAESTTSNIKIVPVKVLDNNGKGNLSVLIQGINYVKDYVDVINISLGINNSDIGSNNLSIANNILKSVYDKGAVVVCAAGNDGTSSVSFPASNSYTYATSAVNKNNKISSFSNYGSEIDFALPGESLLLPSNVSNTSYEIDSGTSFASPFLASAVALIKSNNKSYTNSEIYEILKRNAVDLGTSGKDNYYGYGSINFNTDLFYHPVIASLTASAEYSEKNKVSAKVISGTSINSYTVTENSNTPLSWQSITDAKNFMNFSFNINKNGTFYIWFKNAINEIASKVITVNNIDNEKPIIKSTLSATDITSSNSTLRISAVDTLSGIGHIKWYYKKSSSSTYSEITDEYNKEKVLKEWTHKFTGLSENTTYNFYAEIFDAAGNYITTEKIDVITPSSSAQEITYTAHVENIGWQGSVSNANMIGTEGKSLRMEAIKISLKNKKYAGDIVYQSHVQDIGWQNAVANGTLSGTEGLGKRLEAIKISLTGELANHYDIYYRTHVENFGWTGWAKNGEASGSAGYGYRMEALKILVVPKNVSINLDTTNSYYETPAVLTYESHIENIGWQGIKQNSETSGIIFSGKRIEGLRINLLPGTTSGNIVYQAHVENIGWQNPVSNGMISGTVGNSLRLEAIKISLTGDLANKYDIYYRTYIENFGWTGWAKNGEISGSSNYCYRMEAIEISLIKKGDKTPTSTRQIYYSK